MPSPNRKDRAGTVGTRLLPFFVLLLGSIACGAATPATQTTIDPSRLALAMDYGNPNAHLVFAKQLKARGNALAAFFVCENARTLFGEDAFECSFDIVFQGHITDVLFHARKQVLQTALQIQPRSLALLKQMADLDEAHGESDDAANVLRRALLVDPDNFSIVQSLERNLAAAGKRPDAAAMLNQWYRNHPDTPPAWEQRIEEQIAQNSDSAGEMLDEAIARFPSDGRLHLMRAKLNEEQKPDGAAADFIAGARLTPDSADAQASAGRFFLKTHADAQRALEYYLAAYFLDPGFNDWETVNERVRDAAEAVAQPRIAVMKEAAATLEAMIADPNPVVAIDAMGQASGDLPERISNQLLSLCASDCPEVGQAAVQLLIAHPSSVDPRTLDAAMKNADPWVRAAAVPLIAGIQKTGAIEKLFPLLADKCILVRYTAATALLGKDIAARSVVVRAMKGEPSAWLRNVVADAVAGGGQ